MYLNPENNQVFQIQKGKGILGFFRSLLNNHTTVLDEEEYFRKELIRSIESARTEWISANTNFEYVDENDMVDYYAYKIKACEIRYEYLIKKAKEQGIKVQSPEIK